MEIKGTVQPEEVLPAVWLHFRSSGSMAIVGAILLVLLVWALWMSFFERSPNDTSRWTLLAFVVYLLVALAIWVPYKTRRTYRQRKDLHREYRFTVSDGGLIVDNENGHMTRPWSDFLKWKEGTRFFLLYLSDSMFQIVPKRFFHSQGEIDAFREVLKTRVGQTKTVPKG